MPDTVNDLRLAAWSDNATIPITLDHLRHLNVLYLRKLSATQYSISFQCFNIYMNVASCEL